MRWLALGSVCLLFACGVPEVQQQQLKDGSWQFTCQLPMAQCVNAARDACRLERYRILEGNSETRLRDAPPFERAYHTSTLHFACTDDGGNPLLDFGNKPEPQASEPARAPSAASCIKGDTRACVGPAGCTGGQSCLADGSGYGACDCGGANAASPPTATPATGVESSPLAPGTPAP
jgi:hypothetical protein